MVAAGAVELGYVNPDSELLPFRGGLHVPFCRILLQSYHGKLEPRLLDGALLLEHLHRLDCRSAVYLQQESHKKLDEKLQASTNFPGPHSRMTESPLDQGFSGLESSPRPRLIARCKNFEKTYFYI